MLRHTNSDHPDFNNLTRALDVVRCAMHLAGQQINPDRPHHTDESRRIGDQHQRGTVPITRHAVRHRAGAECLDRTSRLPLQ